MVPIEESRPSALTSKWFVLCLGALTTKEWIFQWRQSPKITSLEQLLMWAWGLWKGVSSFLLAYWCANRSQHSRSRANMHYRKSCFQYKSVTLGISSTDKHFPHFFVRFSSFFLSQSTLKLENGDIMFHQKWHNLKKTSEHFREKCGIKPLKGFPSPGEGFCKFFHLWIYSPLINTSGA